MKGEELVKDTKKEDRLRKRSSFML